MIELEKMLMIGSAGRNAGKTEFACRLIRCCTKDRDIIAVKVTTIADTNSPCPRGVKGCGVCSSLKTDFEITEETCPDSGKDTSRLLAAGAKKVYWLRIRKDKLAGGAKALADLLGPDCRCVCESNSLRLTVKPSLFIIVKEAKSTHFKATARAVAHLADKIVTCDGTGFDPAPETISPTDQTWAMKLKATAILLAGGTSSRMGADKAMLPITGRPMIEHICRQLRPWFDQVLISAADTQKYSFLNLPIIPDKTPDQGPLMAIASALPASQSDLNFVTACDIPQIDMSVVRKMLALAEAFDAVVPTTADGEHQPLFAVYNKTALPAINKTLAAGRRKITDAFTNCRVKYSPFEVAHALNNLNTLLDYENFKDSCND